LPLTVQIWKQLPKSRHFLNILNLPVSSEFNPVFVILWLFLIVMVLGFIIDFFSNEWTCLVIVIFFRNWIQTCQWLYILE
jgi:hypothetical protein